MKIDKKKKYISGSLAAMATVVSVCGISANANVSKDEYLANNKTDSSNITKNEANNEMDADDLAEELTGSLNIEEKDVYKDETVYVFSDANGNKKQILVNEVLKNPEGKAELTDVTDLDGIVNLKGDETFSQSGDKITWQANGNDIYYQGTSNKELPVDVKVTYSLDGKEIAPEDLAGKSGKVTIRFDYTNNEKVTKEINGANEDIYVPFAAITGMVLGDNFSNVSVENGKTMKNGDSNIIVGYGMPGLMDSFGTLSEDLSSDITIPDYFEVTADVEDFSLDMTVTVVVNASSLNVADGINFSSVDDLIDTLTDASSQLVDGSAQLSDGLSTLQEKMGDFSTGVDTLKTGTESLFGGTSELAAGASTLATGAATIQTGMNTLAESSGALVNGINTINGSAAAVRDGVAALDTALNQKMTEAEKQATAKQAADTYARDMQATVSGNLYAGLRYNADGTDSALYQSLYDGAFYKNASDVIYEGAVNAVLATAAGASGDSATLAAGIRGAYAGGASAFQLYMTDPQNYVAAGYPTDAESIQTYLGAFVTYQATANLNPSQLAEYLYAQGHDTTLYYVAEATLKEQLAAGRNNGDIQAGVEGAIKTIADTIAAQSSTIVEQATIAGAEGAKAQIAAQIEAVGENGYSLVTGAAALATGTSQLAGSMPTLTGGISQLVDGIDQLATGAGTLNTGAGALYSGASQLNTGAGALVTGASQIIDGVGQLSDGAIELKDGMLQFDEEAIQKLVEAYNGDVKDFAERLHAVVAASTDYDTYTKLADGDEGTTKFIIKTDAISAE